MSRKKISKEESKIYWDLVKAGKTHIEAYEISEAAFKLTHTPNYQIKVLNGEKVNEK